MLLRLERNLTPASFCIRDVVRSVADCDGVVASVDKWLMREAAVRALAPMRLASCAVVDCMALKTSGFFKAVGDVGKCGGCVVDRSMSEIVSCLGFSPNLTSMKLPNGKSEKEQQE